MKQLQDIFIYYNDVRPFRSTLLNKIIGNSSKWLIKRMANIILPCYFHHHPAINEYKKAQLEKRVSEAIVSLTSFPQRIGVVWLVIECLLRQTRVPRKIIIYLSRDQFPTEKDIPKTLMAYPSDIVEVKFVHEDIRSHKKYWYAVSEFPNSSIVLVDDDLIYDSHMIEDLESVSKKNNVVSCCWGRSISWNEDGTPRPYSQWDGKPVVNEISNTVFFGSGGGTYFPSGSLAGAKQPTEQIMQISPTADDIFLNAIVRINGYKICLVRRYISIPEWQIRNNVKLNSVNNGKFQNDIQLTQVRMFMEKIFGIDPFLIK